MIWIDAPVQSKLLAMLQSASQGYSGIAGNHLRLDTVAFSLLMPDPLRALRTTSVVDIREREGEKGYERA